MYVSEVVEAFVSQSPGWSENLTTDGGRIMSYGVVIGRWESGKVVLPNAHVTYSRTTTRHRNLVRRVAIARRIEVIEA